ncbi:hypothetical protein GA0061096_1358 [Fictibacillus enclensis]|uniref:Uncharacterized protein n=1 Tax=Fictibacillus enclensis TaxID=1017270 RepID=A0A0V8JE36_9BACL|nr:hypothetical protein [Fictibacillus enclensis]KSU85164.1 hypothetical protein AS030_06505 [Fictibacillus enclensis]SCB92019.1 hypothetical protein GA0061096_1358 [Fictibacillus enclensis]
MVLAMSIVLGLLGAVGYFLVVGESNTPADRKKKLGLWLNLVAQIPWVVFNLTTVAWGLFPVNVITVISSIRGLRLLRILSNTTKESLPPTRVEGFPLSYVRRAKIMQSHPFFSYSNLLYVSVQKSGGTVAPRRPTCSIYPLMKSGDKSGHVIIYPDKSLSGFIVKQGT